MAQNRGFSAKRRRSSVALFDEVQEVVQAESVSSSEEQKSVSSSGTVGFFSSSFSSASAALPPLVPQILESLDELKDVEIQALVDATIKGNALTTPEAADLLYNLTLVQSDNKELCRAAHSLQENLAIKYAEAAGWYFDRYKDLEQIAALISPFAKGKKAEEILKYFLSVSKADIDTLATLADQGHSAEVEAKLYQAHLEQPTFIGAWVRAVSKNFSSQLLNLPPVLLAWQENKGSGSEAEARAKAEEKYKKVNFYRERKAFLYSLLQKGGQINERPQFQAAHLEGFMRFADKNAQAPQRKKARSCENVVKM